MRLCEHQGFGRSCGLNDLIRLTSKLEGANWGFLSEAICTKCFAKRKACIVPTTFRSVSQKRVFPDKGCAFRAKRGDSHETCESDRQSTIWSGVLLLRIAGVCKALQTCSSLASFLCNRTVLNHFLLILLPPLHLHPELSRRASQCRHLTLSISKIFSL